MSIEQARDDFRLVICGIDGRPTGLPADLPEALIETCDATAELYRRTGFTPPWVSYIALRGSLVIGGGAFVGPPFDNRVEIAYFTLAEFEGQGCATLTATQLVKLARDNRPGVEIFAKTLPHMNASTSILSRLGFKKIGNTIDDDVGEAWAWLLSGDKRSIM
jgi:RimJ/RimL family protein N-acetyltransferase